MKKYALHPGMVESRYDGEFHFISATQLMRLYGLKIDQCVIIHEINKDYLGYDLDKFIHLYPRYDGNYILKDSK